MCTRDTSKARTEDDSGPYGTYGVRKRSRALLLRRDDGEARRSGTARCDGQTGRMKPSGRAAAGLRRGLEPRPSPIERFEGPKETLVAREPHANDARSFDGDFARCGNRHGQTLVLADGLP